jgi:hypothetical protein
VIESHEDLIVWQKGMELVFETYRLSADLERARSLCEELSPMLTTLQRKLR